MENSYVCFGDIAGVRREKCEDDDAVFEGSVFVVAKRVEQHERSTVNCVDVLDQGNFV